MLTDRDHSSLNKIRNKILTNVDSVGTNLLCSDPDVMKDPIPTPDYVLCTMYANMPIYNILLCMLSRSNTQKVICDHI